MHMLQPRILAEGMYSIEDVVSLKTHFPIWEERDIYQAQLRELFEITHPELLYASDREARQEAFVRERMLKTRAGILGGSWVYFPWSGELLHTLSEKELYQVRTNRNRNLITTDEQTQLSAATIGVIGLSVGSGVATALTYSGIGSTYKIAEFDTLETTNLNRIRTRLGKVGATKLSIVAEQMYDVNPFVRIIPFSSGLTKEVLEKFVCGEPRPRVIFEIIDSFEMKVHLRELARRERIPVIMVTNLGDRVLLDVERYDVSSETPLFNGRAGTVPRDMLEKPDVTPEQKHAYAVSLAGVQHIPERALASVEQIGKTLVGRPQLSSTVTVATGLCSYLARQIVLGNSTLSGSWLINFDVLFSPITRLSL